MTPGQDGNQKGQVMHPSILAVRLHGGLSRRVARALTVVTLATLTAGVASPIDAAPRPGMIVVVHVTDRAQVPAGEWAEAKQLVSWVFKRIGVRTIWADGAAAAVPVDGAFHVDVVILSTRAAAVADDVFGSAVGLTKLADVYFGPIADYATRTRSFTSRLLGMVIAHEIGHLLLPAGHSSYGIMQAHWYGRILVVSGFTNDQGVTIRRLFAARSER
jgi:hypothetical protein